MYVNKKEIVLFFCRKYWVIDLRGKKAAQRLVLHVQFFVRAECFAHVPARAQAIASILLESLGTLVFRLIYGVHCYFFRFAYLMFLSFSQDNIRTPKKLGTPQKF